MADSRDFAPGSSPGAQQGEKSTVHDVPDIETGRKHSLYPPLHSVDTNASIATEVDHPNVAPILRHRKSHVGTYWGTFPAVVDNPRRPLWKPGQEPGLDPARPNGGREQLLPLRAECDITVVDYSEDDMVMRRLTNETLPIWLERTEKMEKEGSEELAWAKCRWINVNGLSWDVIQALGKYKNLHSLAIEDMVNTKNRTKADWYSDHTFLILTLQKLVKLPEDCESDSDSDEESDLSKSPPGSLKEKRSWVSKLLNKLGRRDPTIAKARAAVSSDSPEDIMTGHSARYKRAGSQLRTLQRYGGGPNQEFMTFMEQNSAMTRNGLAVCAEQVSIFLHGSNTVISFFEQSADDIETPILRRLATPETILRRSCDASMLVQSIIDAIIDHAVPIATAYSEIIQELELDVLTEPNIKHTRELYLLTSETATMRNFISPIATLIRALRDRTAAPNSPITANTNTFSRHESGPPPTLTSTVDISPLAHTYLGDVEDHCLSILSELDQIATSASGLISLIFNTISAYQNESMKQLTVVTVILLPLTVITGFYGMNFNDFDALNNDTNYFWSIAAPVAIGMGLLMMREMIVRYFKKTISKWGRRRRRERREKKAREREQRKRREL
ncbi:hypothetical protein V495_06398 [Pseudogymnoascus sp. VKM F-4514 (FW-929)]|nr:hypothetical protein V490_08817 [Pseudogymnoascus sp. VKM F-3557]KFY38751.1 hypothetical protein V495_06398 [Pseudogymnoascus sp. VKM F-4514 (FW-929)]KFY54891.1 hypothetical protein V497_07366 [Pseudogymnoascus sp. VKM F-4516 (FW-969)]